MSKKQLTNNKNLVNFLFEASTLKRLERTGWQILGENEESIAEHSFMVCVISFSLGRQLNVNLEKVLIMALFHDFTEARIGDIYKLADIYVKADVMRTAKDTFSKYSFGQQLVQLTREYEEEKTLEAQIVHDADTLALMIELKQLIENGNLNAKEWFDANTKALKLPASKDIADAITKGNSQDWWKREREKLHKSFKK